MTSENNIASAIARSTSHNEIVKVEVAEISAALAEVNVHCEDYDSTDENRTEDGRRQEDVWGTTEDGSEFRLLLVEAV